MSHLFREFVDDMFSNKGWKIQVLSIVLILFSNGVILYPGPRGFS